MKDTQKAATSTTGTASRGFKDEERAAVRERANELKSAARRGPCAGKADGESDVLAKIAEMADLALPISPSISRPRSTRRPTTEQPWSRQYNSPRKEL